MNSKTPPVFLIDSNSILCRYFFALNEMFDENGVNVNGLFGFCGLLRKLLKQHSSIVLACAFDKCINNFRKVIDPNYKANRKKSDSSLIVQINLAEQLCRDLNIPVFVDPKYEADDLIGTLSKNLKQNYENINLVSTDKDFLQLVNEKVVLWNPFTKTIMTESAIKNKYSISSKDFHLFLALCGDSSDNIPGIKNVGPKTAVKIIQYINQNNSVCPQDLQKAFPKFDFTPLDLMQQLTKMYTDCQVVNPSLYSHNISNFNNKMRTFGFNSLVI